VVFPLNTNCLTIEQTWSAPKSVQSGMGCPASNCATINIQLQQNMQSPPLQKMVPTWGVWRIK